MNVQNWLYPLHAPQKKFNSYVLSSHSLIAITSPSRPLTIPSFILNFTFNSCNKRLLTKRKVSYKSDILMIFFIKNYYHFMFHHHLNYNEIYFNVFHGTFIIQINITWRNYIIYVKCHPIISYVLHKKFNSWSTYTWSPNELHIASQMHSHPPI